MAGRKTSSDASPPESASFSEPEEKQADRAEKIEVRIPTVMISMSDGAELSNTVKLLQKKKKQAQVRVDVSMLPMMLDSEYMGNLRYPKIRISTNMIHVMSRGNWGAMLTSVNGQEWQLFLLPKSDLVNEFQSIWSVGTTSNTLVTSNSACTYDSLTYYRYSIARKCPSTVAVQSTIVKLDFTSKIPNHSFKHT
jgi:hypothetical protein